MKTTHVANILRKASRIKAPFIVDTASTSEVKEVRDIPGINLCGVTTNPIILQKHLATLGKDQLLAQLGTPRPNILNSFQVKEMILKNLLAALPEGSLVFAQVDYVKNDPEIMIDQGKRLSAIAPDNIVIKVPLYKNGLLVMLDLEQANIPTAATAIITTTQAKLAILKQATFIIPFMGRADKLHAERMENPGLEAEAIASQYLLKQVTKLIIRNKSNAMLLPASVKTLKHLQIIAGLRDTFPNLICPTLPPNLIIEQAECLRTWLPSQETLAAPATTFQESGIEQIKHIIASFKEAETAFRSALDDSSINSNLGAAAEE